MDKILENLNEEQRAAVLQKDGPILIIAGAGSGKTRVLTSKIALLLQGGVSPYEILALTFTKKAAGEMTSRIRSMVGENARGLAIGTFHSVFIQLLRIYHEFAGFPENFTIYDEDDSLSCLKGCIGETLFGESYNDKQILKNLTDEQKTERKALMNIYKAKTIRDIITRAKNNLITPKAYKEDTDLRQRDAKASRPLTPQIYELYMKRCRRAGAMDFDDILLYMHYVLSRYPEVRRALGERFKYILVDEYQDTNMVQYEIVQMLASVHGNICVVGDDSQSIYAFRGARIQNILNFKKDYPAMKTFRLETNYRSTAAIVSAANRLIANNLERLPKTCVAVKGEGEPITVERCRDDRSEAQYVAAFINDGVHLYGEHYSDFAVLYRTNAQARALEDALIRERVPYMVYSGLSFFDRAEVKDVLAYMRLVVNKDDDEAFKRICNRPARGISDATLNTLAAAASRTNLSLFSLAENPTPESTSLKPKACDALRSFTGLISSITEKTREMNAYEATQVILDDTGIFAYYQNEEGEDGLKKSNNVKELLNSVLYFMQDQQEEYRRGMKDGAPKVSLLDYLENIALLSNADTRDDGGEKVSLMTSHCSKGLEFQTVFVVGAEEGLFPLVRDESAAFDVEEERRLFYVSITRAMDRLVITHCENRWKYGEMEPGTTSRFIEEMGLDPDEDDDLPEA